MSQDTSYAFLAQHKIPEVWAHFLYVPTWAETLSACLRKELSLSKALFSLTWLSWSGYRVSWSSCSFSSNAVQTALIPVMGKQNSRSQNRLTSMVPNSFKQNLYNRKNSKNLNNELEQSQKRWRCCRIIWVVSDLQANFRKRTMVCIGKKDQVCPLEACVSLGPWG